LLYQQRWPIAVVTDTAIDILANPERLRQLDATSPRD
jgi:hypothetical protein